MISPASYGITGYKVIKTLKLMNRRKNQTMITVNRLDGSELVINGLLIELIEQTPDTMLTLTTGKKIIVLQSVEEIIQQFEEFIIRTRYIIK